MTLQSIDPASPDTVWVTLVPTALNVDGSVARIQWDGAIHELRRGQPIKVRVAPRGP